MDLSRSRLLGFLGVRSECMPLTWPGMRTLDLEAGQAGSSACL
jgi:hypothetical protein